MLAHICRAIGSMTLRLPELMLRFLRIATEHGWAASFNVARAFIIRQIVTSASVRGNVSAANQFTSCPGAEPTLSPTMFGVSDVANIADTGETGNQRSPVISILMPVHNTDPVILNAAIQSVLAQTYANWELCIADDCSTNAATVQSFERYRGLDPRIKIVRSSEPLHIARATNLAAEYATGEFVGFLDHDDLLAAEALALVAQAICQHPEVDFIYSDEDKIEEDGRRSEPYLKPDWSPEHLLSVMYVLHLIVVRKRLFWELGGLRHEYTGAQDYDLALRATARSRRIVHIRRILYHWRKIPGSAAAVVDAKPAALLNARRALGDFVANRDPEAQVVDGLLPGTFRIKWAVPPGVDVTLVILTAGRRRRLQKRGDTLLVENFVDSILANSTYTSYRLLIVDDNGCLPAAVRRKIERANGSVVSFPLEGTFNYARKVNFALSLVKSECVILLNDDLEVISPDWIETLLGSLLQEGVGAVGPRLLFEDRRIQHAGVVLGSNWGAGHIFRGVAVDRGSYCSFAHVARNYSAVTGAALATRMSLLKEVGLFDPELAVDFNDIDFCLRLRAAGHRIVYTPFAQLYHFENSSFARNEQDRRERALFEQRWRQHIECDPYYHPLLPRDGLDCDFVHPPTPQSKANDRQPLDPAASWRQHCRTIEADVAAINDALADADADAFEYRAQLLARREIIRSGLFDPEFYLNRYADVRQAGADPLDHYISHGWLERRLPNSVFDPHYYAEVLADRGVVGMNPLLHYVRQGEAAGLKPCAAFSPAEHLSKHLNIAGLGISPLWHWMKHLAGHEQTQRPIDVSAPQVASIKTRPRWQRPNTDLGVNFVGPLEVVSGLGTSSRGYLSALQHARVRVRPTSWKLGFEHQQHTTQTLTNMPAQPISIIHLNADNAYLWLPRLSGLLTEKTYNIAILFWEIAAFRSDWLHVLSHFDEVWCASEFMVRSLASVFPRPVRLVRPALLPVSARHKGSHSDFGIPKDKYRFLYMFDVGSRLDRKNPAGLIRAYCDEFRPDEGAALVLKVSYPAQDATGVEEFKGLIRGRPDIVVIEEVLPADLMPYLWSQVDCYVSPHRTEGLGVTVIEAMQASKPVIATAYGGVTDFVREDTAFPIRHHLVEIGKSVEPYPAGAVWAEPSTASLRQLMRWTFQHRAAAAALGASAGRFARDMFSLERTSSVVRAEIERIWSAAPSGSSDGRAAKKTSLIRRLYTAQTRSAGTADQSDSRTGR